MTTKNLYENTVNQITKENFHYIAITPTEGLKSLEEFRFLIKKSMRDFSKKLGVKKSKNYLDYLSVIEVNPTITKGEKLFNDKFPKMKFESMPWGESWVSYEPDSVMDEMGYHTHIFVSLPTDGVLYSNSLRSVWTNTFNKSEITINWFEKASNEIKTLPKFINYHMKQLDQLDGTFLVSNLNVNP
jgi:hypothetical protein